MSSGMNILGILNYNENKVKQGSAECIAENFFGSPVNNLTFSDKIRGFEFYTKQNRRATTKAVHISLNFHPTEKLSKEMILDISSEYMDKIGFGNQPYLVYQHHDSAHPHIHIVTTNIQRDGKRIILYNIGRNQSEKARKQIENKFGLVKAGGKHEANERILNPIDVKKILYGKSETKGAISNIVRMAVKHYKFTSLPELNAVLLQYNIKADRGSERSQMFQKKGLLYRVIDGKGNSIGVPIKASAIYGKPTLPFLEKQFKLNEILRKTHRERLAKVIDASLNKGKQSKASFVRELNSHGIFVVFRQNEEGRTYGITFVDNQSKVVFNGSDLGKQYGANSIMERLTPSVNSSNDQSSALQPMPTKEDSQNDLDTGFGDVIQDLTDSRQFDFTNPNAGARRRKKKKRGHSL